MRTPIRLLSLLFLLALALPATAQDTERTDREYEELIEKLELGIVALDELGREDACDIVKRVADEVRRERAQARARAKERKNENAEIREVRRRLAVMRYAVAVFVDADRVDAAELVERAMHAREMAIEGRRDEEARKIREAAPDRAQLAETLKYASELQADRGYAEKAQALADLSAVYLDQWKRRQQSRERDAKERNFEDRRARLEVLRFGRDAHREAGNQKPAEILANAVRIAELQAEGVQGERLQKAVEDAGAEFTIGWVIESLQGATGLYRKWEMDGRANATNGLAEFYAKRERDRRRGEERESPPAVSERDARIEEIQRLTAQLEELEAALAKLRAELRAIDR